MNRDVINKAIQFRLSLIVNAAKFLSAYKKKLLFVIRNPNVKEWYGKNYSFYKHSKLTLLP